MKQLPLAFRDSPAPDFHCFVPGPNAAALAGLQRMAASLLDASSTSPALAPSELSALVYLWGESGTGKSHLLAALASACEERGARVRWFGATGDEAEMDAPMLEAGCDLVILDDCDRYGPDQQQRAFRAFVEAASGRVAVAAAGRLPPTDLPLRDDLRSRLGWGQVYALQALTDADVRSVLAREAERRRLPLSGDVVDFLLTRFQRDLKHLMGLLDRLDDFALAQQRVLTVPLLKQMLAEPRIP